MAQQPPGGPGQQPPPPPPPPQGQGAQPGYGPPPQQQRGRGVRLALAAAAVLVGLIVLIVALVALFGNATIDAGELEQAIQDDADAAGVDVDSVDCPDDEEAEQGNRFDCTITLADGSEVPIPVEVQDDEGNVAFGNAVSE